jgi:hypothetical protein
VVIDGSPRQIHAAYITPHKELVKICLGKTSPSYAIQRMQHLEFDLLRCDWSGLKSLDLVCFNICSTLSFMGTAGSETLEGLLLKVGLSGTRFPAALA